MLHVEPAVPVGRRAVAGVTTPLGELLPRLRAEGVRAVSPTGVLGDPAGRPRGGGALLDGWSPAWWRRPAPGGSTRPGGWSRDPGAAPDRLPDGFAVRLDPRTRRRDDGATLIGGSRCGSCGSLPRAHELLVADRLVVSDGTSAAVAARLLDAGLAHPDLPASAGGDVTVVVPVKDRAAGLTRLLGALHADPAAGSPVVVVDDESAEPSWPPAPSWSARRRPRPRRRAQRRAPPGDDAVRGLPRLRLRATAGLARGLRPHVADPRLALVAPRIVALPGGRRSWFTAYENAGSALDMGTRTRRPSAQAPRLQRAQRRAARPPLGARRRVRRDHAGGRGRRPRLAAGRRGLAGAVRAIGRRRPRAPGHDGVAPPPGVLRHRRRAAGHPARRRGGAPGALARHRARLGAHPGRRTPWRGRRPSVTGGETVAPWPAGWAGPSLPGRRSPPPWSPGRLASGRSLALAATRHHWPLALAAAIVSRSARRLLGAVVLDAVDGWWGHRREVDSADLRPRPRLDDLAYGVGLWAGALRARDPSAAPGAPAARVRPLGLLVHNRMSAAIARQQPRWARHEPASAERFRDPGGGPGSRSRTGGPARLTRRLRAAHEQLVTGTAVPTDAACARGRGLWRRSLEGGGADPDGGTPAVELLDDDLPGYRRRTCGAGHAGHPPALVEDAEADWMIVAVTDSGGRMLWVEGDFRRGPRQPG